MSLVFSDLYANNYSLVSCNYANCTYYEQYGCQLYNNASYIYEGYTNHSSNSSECWSMTSRYSDNMIPTRRAEDDDSDLLSHVGVVCYAGGGSNHARCNALTLKHAHDSHHSIELDAGPSILINSGHTVYLSVSMAHTTAGVVCYQRYDSDRSYNSIYCNKLTLTVSHMPTLTAGSTMMINAAYTLHLSVSALDSAGIVCYEDGSRGNSGNCNSLTPGPTPAPTPAPNIMWDVNFVLMLYGIEIEEFDVTAQRNFKIVVRGPILIQTLN